MNRKFIWTMVLLVTVLVGCIIYANVESQVKVMVVGGGEAACSTPTGSLLSEGFEGTGYEDGMADNQGSAEEDYDISVLSPLTGGCDYGLQTNYAGSDVDAEWDNGSAISHDDSITITCLVYFDSIAYDVNYNVGYLIHWDDDDVEWSEGMAEVEVQRNDSGGERYRIRANGDSSYSTAVTVEEDTWYTLIFKLDSNGTSSLQCNECADSTEYSFTPNSTSGRYLRIGASEGLSANDAINAIFAYCTVDDPAD